MDLVFHLAEHSEYLETARIHQAAVIFASERSTAT